VGGWVGEGRKRTPLWQCGSAVAGRVEAGARHPSHALVACRGGRMRIEDARITVKDRLFGTSSPLEGKTSFSRSRSPELRVGR
jgi:hypothetical protein